MIRCFSSGYRRLSRARTLPQRLAVSLCFAISLSAVVFFVTAYAVPALSQALESDPNVRPYGLPTAPPYTVALDPGHGGGDPGADKNSGTLMKEVEMCEKTVDALFLLLETDINYTPVRTRKNGENLKFSQRIQTVTDRKASLLLSIHGNCDASTRQSHGFECFPTPPGRFWSEQSMQFAKCLTQKMGEARHRLRGETGIRFAYYSGKRKLIVDSTDTRERTLRSFGILEQAPCPAVLAEQCFSTNYADVENWASDTGCQKAAQVYYEAICLYFGTQPVQPGVPQPTPTPTPTPILSPF